MLNSRAPVWLAILMLGMYVVAAQTAVTDDFSDGDFTNDPSWNGDTVFFGVNAAGELRLLDSLAGVRCLYTASEISLEATWEWRCRLDFNPSSSNFLKVYLISDRPDLQLPLKGYFVRVGGSSSDRISLYRQDLSPTEIIAESAPDWVDKDPVDILIRVTRDRSHHWQVFADTTLTGNYQLLASGYDSTHLKSSYFGLCPNYTKTRSDRFYFDDFLLQGSPYIDSVSPRLISYIVSDSSRLTLTFSEDLDTNQVASGNFQFSDALQIRSLEMSEQQIDISILGVFENKRLYGLSISNLKDEAGQPLDTLIAFRRVVPQTGDVIINEIMPDPTPSVGIPPFNLPEAEYIEIHNRLPYPIRLRYWLLLIGTKSIDLPDVQLDSMGFLILTNEGLTADFGDSLPVTGLSMSASSLLNSGTSLSLISHQGNTISRLSYDSEYYGNQLKAQGGWSIERIHPDIACEDVSNWTASRDPNGGTPGRPNSVDSSHYESGVFRIEHLSLLDDQSLKISFSRPLQAGQALEHASYRVWPDLKISSIKWMPETPSAVELTFDRTLSKSKVYSLSPGPELMACDGRRADQDTLRFGLPEAPLPGDLLINEVLFNPYSSGVDFVELYNASDKSIDLSTLRIGNWDDQVGLSPNAVALTDESRIWIPGQYLLVTEEIDALRQHYQTGKAAVNIELSNMPSLPDDAGSIAVQTAAFEVIDYFEYDEDMHHPLVSDPEGVSLERLSIQNSTQGLDNWHSAAGIVGFATPGYRNSQYISSQSVAQVSLDPRVFSPNMDGNNDVLKIRYKFQDPGAIGRITVWSPVGQMINLLAENLLLGKEGMLIWDGTNESGALAAPGVYIVVIEYFSVDEKRSVLRRTCVLSR